MRSPANVREERTVALYNGDLPIKARFKDGLKLGGEGSRAAEDVLEARKVVETHDGAFGEAESDGRDDESRLREGLAGDGGGGRRRTVAR